MTLITSPSNPRISKVRSLHSTNGRKKSGLFLMEGPHLLMALLDAQLLPHEIYYEPALLSRTAPGRELLERLLHNTLYADRLIEVSERVIEALGDAQTSQGVVCVLASEDFAPERVQARRQIVAGSQKLRPALLVLDDLADPGNMGTILRTALATDVDTILLTERCVDYFSPKVVRSAAGAHILLPVQTSLSWDAIAVKVAEHQAHQVLLADMGGSQLYYEADLTQPFALIIGNEAHGPSTRARGLATSIISIPLSNGVESLNAAMATGIVLYEAVRQHRVSL